MEGDVKDQLSDGGTRLATWLGPGTFPPRAVEAVEGDGADGAGTSHSFSVTSHLHISSHLFTSLHISSHLFASLHISDPGWVNHFNCLVLDCWWIMTTAFLSTIPSLCGETSHGHSTFFHTINALCPTSKQRGKGTVFALQACPMQGTYEPNLTKTKNHEFRHWRTFLVSICVYVAGGLGWWFGSLGIDGFVKLDQNYQTLSKWNRVKIKTTRLKKKIIATRAVSFLNLYSSCISENIRISHNFTWLFTITVCINTQDK
jgi:hypothetical protein